MTENEISKIIVNSCYQIHTKLGPGLFESVYEQVLEFELIEEGLFIQRQQAIPVVWKGQKLDQGFQIGRASCRERV